MVRAGLLGLHQGALSTHGALAWLLHLPGVGKGRWSGAPGKHPCVLPSSATWVLRGVKL